MKLTRRELRILIESQLGQEDASMLPVDGEYNIPKNVPFVVDYDHPDRSVIGDDLYSLIYNSYKDIGGHFKIQQPSDLETNYGAQRDGQWLVADVDADPQIDVGLVGKVDAAVPGVSLSAGASDGSRPGKSSMKNMLTDKMKTGEWWGSASGLLAISLINRGAPPLENELLARQYEPKMDVWYGEYPVPVGAKDPDTGMIIDADHPFRKIKGWFGRTWAGHMHLKHIFASV